MIYPESAASFPELRGAANSRAAAGRHPGRAVDAPTGGVKKPATRRQKRHLEAAGRAQKSTEDAPLRGRSGVALHSSIAVQTYACACRGAMLDTPRPCDMLENSQKGHKFREVVSLPVLSLQCATAWARGAPFRPHRRSVGSRPGSPSMGLRDTIVWSFRDLRGARFDRYGRGRRPLHASRAPRHRADRPLRVTAKLSQGRGSPHRDDTAWPLQSMASSKRSTWRWGLVNEETA